MLQFKSFTFKLPQFLQDLGKETYKHSYDKSGKSTITDIVLVDKNGNKISIQCYDWSDELPYWDQLRIRIANKIDNYSLHDKKSFHWNK